MLLTIAIPTYKRCKYVVQNVSYLIPQLISHKRDVRLIVTDNHSEDGTYESLIDLEGRYPDLIKIFKQSENIGWMNNFFFAIEHSESEYVFLLGDDDIVSPNFLDIVLPLLRDGGNKLGMLHFNYLKGPSDLSNETCMYPDFHNSDMIEIYHDTKVFIKKFTTGPSFISSVVFRKACMVNGKRDNLKLDTFDYSWFLCLLTGIVDYDVIYYKMPLCVQRLGGFYPSYCTNYVIGMYNVFKHLDPYLPGVLSFWKEYFAKQHRNIAMSINQIIPYRDIYINYYGMFREALPTENLRKLLKVALLWPEFWARKYFRIYWMIHK